MSSSPTPDATAAATVGVNDTLLYHQTLIPTQNVTHAIEGSFTLPDANDLVLIRHNVLELWRLYAEDATGGIECICRTPLFTTVLAAVAVPTSASAMAKSSSGSGSAGGASSLDDAATRAHRGGVHYLAVTSDTGYVTLLRYELAEPPVPTRLGLGESEAGTATANGGGNAGATVLVTTSLRGRFVRVSEACLGRSGARLTVPGARMAVDPAGTALFITALMRTKTLIPILKNDSWDAVKGANAGAEVDSGSDGGSGSDDNDEEEEGEGGGQRGPMSARERRAARRRRAANARRANGAIQLGSPIEVQRQTVLYSVCALDGYLDQAVFAVLEEEVVEAQESGSSSSSGAGGGGSTFLKASAAMDGGLSSANHHKHFVLYAYVPSLKQVQRTQLVHVPPSAHRLIAVPAAPFGPGGVLVCTDVELTWYDVSATQQQQQQQSGALAGRAGVFKCTCAFPRRMDCSELLYDPSIIQHTLTCFGHRFFLLVQDEQGDVYRVFLDSSNVQRAYEALRTRELLQAHPEMLLANGGALPPVPNPLAVHYFDTLFPASAMALFRRGFLFVGNEAGAQHELYKIRSNGYTSDREYVVKRVRRERVLPLPPPSAAAAPKKKEETVKAEGEAQDGKDDRKRPRDDGDAATVGEGAVVKAEPVDPTAPPATTGMLPPLPRIKQEPDGDGDGETPQAPAVTGAMPPPTVSPAAPPAATAFKPPVETRVIKVYQPHRRPQHVAQLQSLPNTPAITSFTAQLTSSAALNADGDLTGPVLESEGTSSGNNSTGGAAAISGEQPEIFFNYVGGRGSESVLVQARYGYAAKLEGRHVLPAVFAAVIPLASASSMQALAQQQHAAIEAAARSGTAAEPGSSLLRGSAARQQAQRLKALRQLAATVSAARDQVWTDRVLLCTRQGTTVYKIGRTVEQDGQAGFITAERTIAATTLQRGCGYVQVTPRGIHVLSTAASMTRHAADSVVPTSWTHPHGNTVLAAAVTPSSILLSFTQHGGLASFDFGLTGLELQQRDVLPTFPLAPVMAVLQPPASAVSAALQRELQGLLWSSVADSSTSSSSSSSSSAAAAAAAAAAATAAAQTEQLAAIATVNQEVYLVHPRKLREPLEKIACRRGAAEVTITALLLTYLGDVESGGDAMAALAGGRGSSARGGRGGSAAAAGSRRQLVLLIGHSDGVVTRCELNPSSAKVMSTAELWCGAHPCQLVVGDGETYCYVVSGERAWRCAAQDGAVKMTPYSFPTRPNAFARFVLPSRSATAGDGADSGDSTAVALAAQEDSAADGADLTASVGTITLAPREQQQEVVIAVQSRELALYVSNTNSGGGGGGDGAGGGSGGGVAYSFRHHPLPLAGRRLLQHPTRSAYLIVCGVEHRGHSRQEIEQHRAEDLAFLKQRTLGDGTTAAASAAAAAPPPEEALGLYGGIPYTAPHRSLGRANTHHSMLQLYHQGVQRLLPPIHFEPNEVITSVVVGSFHKEFGREPVVIVGTASMYTHGAGCGSGATWKQGFLRTFRCSSSSGTASGAGGDGGAGQGGPLRLELLHSTYLRPDSGADGTPSSSRPMLNAEKIAEESRPDYASALCVCEEVGLLFVGLGSAQGLRIYSWGKEQLLRRRHLAHTPGQRINAIDYVFASPPGSRNGNAHSTSYDAMDLYQCPYGDERARRLAREKQLLIVCGTVNASVFIAALQPGQGVGGGGGAGGSASTPSFLLQIVSDRVPRYITSVVVVDERTIAAADRFGTVVFLRIPQNTRTQFAQPVSQLTEAELVTEETYLRTQQTFEEVARHHTGQVVTALRVQPYDPSHGADRSLATRIVYYATALGAVGAFVPFVSEEDGALAAYVQPLLQSHLRPLLAPPTALPPSALLCHHIVDGDLVQQLLRAGGSGGAGSGSKAALASAAGAPYTAAAREEVEEALERQVKVEAARRHVLGLPKRTLPSLQEVVAKQRALLTLPL